jgi:hypothetical protein
MKTSYIADALGVHVNTVRLYEEAGFCRQFHATRTIIASTATYIPTSKACALNLALALSWRQ